ncbi:MAG: FtsQ-type POTRA domain-containing protein, partial [Ruminococcus sp.]|nr:FtsQ-type POTRA domain-containing protein [Ruminococcus sp.]
MKDVEKTNIERANSGKRMRRRKRNMNLYIIIVILGVLCALTAMSYTFLFNIKDIFVIVLSGESSKTQEEAQANGDEVAFASGVRRGDNLLRVDSVKSAENILNEVTFVETAEVHKKFPSVIEIKVSYCIPSFNVEYNGGVLVVSKKGKILERNSFITDGLPTISGIKPVTVEKGKTLTTENEHKNDALEALMESVSEESGISGIDISDEFSIVINYSNGTVFKMGNWNEADYKLQLAETVMNDDSVHGKKGYLTMVGSNQCTFRTSNEPAGSVGNDFQNSVDSEGNTMIPYLKEEINPEQEAIFSEFNSRADENNGITTAVDTSDDTYYDYDY